MPHALSRPRPTAAALILVACGQLQVWTQGASPRVAGDAGQVASPSRPDASETRKPPAESGWPNIQIADPYTRDAARRALGGASVWLTRPRCQSLFAEFKDERQRPLTDKLGELETDPEGYLRMALFLDGAQFPTCKRHGILAFTARGSRVIYLCGRDFERAWRRDSREVQVTIIHELLHSVGLGENPPAARHISDRVNRLCWD